MSDAFLEVIKSWFVKKLGYMVDESRPVKLITRTASDIDLICMHPVKKEIPVKFLGKSLSRRLLIESKGWLVYSVVSCLEHDFTLLKAMKGRVIPEKYTKKDKYYSFVILKEEVFEKGKIIFGTDDFDRVIVVRDMTDGSKQSQKLKKIEELKNSYRKKGVVIIEIHEILIDLFKYISNVDKLDEENIKNKSELIENKAQLRKDLVLGVLNLVHWYKDDIRGTLYVKDEK